MVEQLVKLGAIGANFAEKLARQVMRICRQDASKFFYNLDGPVRNILSRLAALQPDKVWNEITKKLTSRSWDDRFYVEVLLKANRMDESHLGVGLSINVPSQIYINWVRKKPQKRAAMAVAWLPIAEKDEGVRLKWHPELEKFMDEFGDQPNVLPALSLRLHPSSWSGGLAPYLEPVLPMVEGWSKHRSSSVRAWASEQLDWLQKEIAQDLKRSEEDVVHFG